MKFQLLVLGCFVLNGCSHLAYYAQALRGQWEILSRMQSIDQVIAQDTSSVQLKQKLTEILKIRAFATQVLHLPANQSYVYYANLDKPYVVWTVFAAPPFALQLKQWCFPIVGCVSYRGYFTPAPAQVLAQQLRTAGYDVYVTGVAAYSTLGWFNDPVLNTMLSWSTAQIAGLIFHELAHQQLYLKGDTAFNESFASTVETVGVERWLAQYGTRQEILDYQQARQRHKTFIDLVLTTYYQLQQLYHQPWSHAKLTAAAKQAALSSLRTQYTALKKEYWQDYSGYDDWFAQDLNNAKLLAIVTYEDFVPALQILLTQQQGNLKQFYQQVANLGQLSLEQRHAYLHQLMTSY